MVWAFARARHTDAPVFTKFERASERRVNDFIAQSLANSARAFATAEQQDTLLLYRSHHSGKLTAPA